ncbi:hypothetical protein LMG24238_06218 [Paraburkholderia sediminicola]|uniref:TnsA endonuclease-like protein n=1 Tax=Paraburkholderia sediminicola TaxID=458836 RepID=A0A6J5CIW5_9BURK|nr:hypothetical protein [Paraburkholderia sediminicola]CAB3736320.1 hypothetical protein LMG24238_06218 [Paraburkholderia sediminicola]
MSRSPSYGTRSRRTSTTNAGVRLTARTYGKARIGTYAEKAAGHITVESDAERLVAHMLCIDPRVRSFRQQPFTVDLVGERLLFTREELSEARQARGGRAGEVEYTPDFATVQADGLQLAYEVKLEGFEGDGRYWAKVELAREIMEAYCYPLLTVVVPADERHPVLVNAQLLKPAIARAREYLTPDVIDRVEGYCKSGPVLQRGLCADLQIAPGFIPPLLAVGVLQADLAHHHISGALELSAGYGDLSHLYLIEELQP